MCVCVCVCSEGCLLPDQVVECPVVGIAEGNNPGCVCAWCHARRATPIFGEHRPEDWIGIGEPPSLQMEWNFIWTHDKGDIGRQRVAPKKSHTQNYIEANIYYIYTIASIHIHRPNTTNRLTHTHIYIYRY